MDFYTEPPAPRRPTSGPRPVVEHPAVAELREHPGQWARVEHVTDAGASKTIKHEAIRQTRRLQRSEGILTALNTLEDGSVEVWAGFQVQRPSNRSGGNRRRDEAADYTAAS